jgi:hypothetical protein
VTVDSVRDFIHIYKLTLIAFLGGV